MDSSGTFKLYATLPSTRWHSKESKNLFQEHLGYTHTLTRGSKLTNLHQNHLPVPGAEKDRPLISILHLAQSSIQLFCPMGSQGIRSGSTTYMFVHFFFFLFS